MVLSLPFELCGAPEKDFEIIFENVLTLRQKDGIFSLTFQNEEVSGGRTTRNVELSQCKNIRILADASSLEVFLNDGEKVMGSRFYPLEEELVVTCHGLDVCVYELSGMEVKNMF